MYVGLNRFLDKYFSIIKYPFFLFNSRISFKIPFFMGRGASFLISSSRSLITFKGKAKIDRFVEIGGSGEIVAGDHLVVNAYSRIIAENKITIGHDVLIARYVTILDHDHCLDSVFKGDFNKLEAEEITIGNYVWIGDKVTILKGVNIGDNVVIGANSVVTKDIPNNVIIGGIPAIIIKRI